VVSTDIEDSKVTGEVDSLDRWSGVEH